MKHIEVCRHVLADRRLHLIGERFTVRAELSDVDRLTTLGANESRHIALYEVGTRIIWGHQLHGVHAASSRATR